MKDQPTTPSVPPAAANGVERLKELLFDRESAAIGQLAHALDKSSRDLAATRADLTATRDELIRTQSELLDARRDLAANHTSIESLSTFASDTTNLQRQQIAKLETAVERVGTPARLRASMAEVLDGAIRDAEEARHEPLARAMSPLVVRTVRAELRNSQDEMVQLLYPLTGRMVKSYVQSAIKDMMTQINRRLDQNPLLLRLKSVTSGKSMAELALADTQRLRIDEVFLIRRGAGELVERWPTSAIGSNTAIEIGAVLTAINDFAAHKLGEGGDIRSFEVDGFTVLLRGSPLYLLAAKCHGVAPPGVDGELDDAFLTTLSRMAEASDKGGSDLAQRQGDVFLEPFATDLNQRLDTVYERAGAAQGGVSPIKALGYLLALVLMGWAGWWAYTYVTTETVRSQALSTLAAMPELKGYPIAIAVAPRGGSIDVSGLMPSDLVRADFIAKLTNALPRTRVGVDALGVLPEPGNDPRPELENLRGRFASLETTLAAASIGRNLDRASRRLEQAESEVRTAAREARDQQRRASLDAVAAATKAAGERTADIKTALNRGPVTEGTLAELTQPLAGVVQRLNEAMRSLGPAQQASAPSLAQPAVTTAGRQDKQPLVQQQAEQLAEDLALATERLSALAIAVAQLGRVPVPERVIERVVTPAPQIVEVPVSVPVPVPAPAEPTPRDRLAVYIREHAIFFGQGSDWRSPADAERVLDELAALLKASGAPLRVAGYTDAIGRGGNNAALAQARADVVADALVRRGIPRDQLVAIGRPNGPDIGTVSGQNSPNRRVEFEFAFVGETGSQP